MWTPLSDTGQQLLPVILLYLWYTGDEPNPSQGLMCCVF